MIINIDLLEHPINNKGSIKTCHQIRGSLLQCHMYSNTNKIPSSSKMVKGYNIDQGGRPPFM